MTLSSPLLNNTIWRIGLISCLLVYLTKVQEFRQQELLYGQLRSGKVEYIFFRLTPVSMYTPEYVHRSGMSTNIQQFRGKVANLLNLPLTTDLQVCDFVTHKALRSSNREVKVARVLRLQDGVTGEYFVDVVHNGKCFANIWERDQTGEYMDAPEGIRQELTTLCNRGFVALQPSSNLSQLGGTYRGSGFGKSLSLVFEGGTLEDADLRVRAVDMKSRMVMYYPLCDGMISLITPVAELPSEKAATYLLLKRLGGRRQQSLGSTSLRRRRGEDIQVRPQIGHSNDLCGPQHVRRKLERDELNKWDRDLPGKFVLDMKA